MNQTREQNRQQPVGERPTKPVKPLEEDTLPTPDFVSIEVNLATLGFFTPAYKGLKDVKKKTVRITKQVNGKREQKSVTYLPSAAYGLPTSPVDQDFFVAFMKVVRQRKKEKLTITNPITFTTAELLRLAHKYRDSGKNYRLAFDFLQKMTLTGIISHQAIYFANREEWRSDTFHVVERVRSKGHVLEDGSVADKHHVFLSDWLLANINLHHSLPLDDETYFRLKNPTAKALLFPLQPMLYATQEQGYFEKLYSEVCQLLGVRPYQYPSKIREKLGPALDEIKEQGYLKHWEVQNTKDGKAYKICFWHGEKFYEDQRVLKGESKQMTLEEGSGISDTSNTDHPESAQTQADEQPEAEQGIDSQPLVTRLMKWGISEKKTRQLLAKLSPDQPVEDQLDYAESEIAKQGTGPDGIPRPAGFIISRLVENAPVPEHVVSKGKMAKISQEIKRRREVSRAEEQAYQDYLDRQIDRQVNKEYSPESYRAYVESKRLALGKHKPQLNEQALAAWAEQSVREQILQEISPGLLSQQEFIKE